ncbi:Uncharacterised protein [Klebsiella pneumoniae]|nr:Uncharacterised protein [Klebsiella pneumoniae]SXT59176.1 Uncharacterised protein [Klebsiella pneumoniae]
MHKSLIKLFLINLLFSEFFQRFTLSLAHYYLTGYPLSF